MLPAFFAEQLERDYHVNQRWATCLEEQEDELTDEIRLLVSKLINSHHIWNCRLVGQQPESEPHDLMPLAHWMQLIRSNFLETQRFLTNFSDEEKIRYHDSEGVQLEDLPANMLFALLQTNHFYRAQLEWVCQLSGLTIPSAELFRL